MSLKYLMGLSKILHNNGQRNFFDWFNAAFNKVDLDRIKEVGVDRAAAEWILRCGGGVKWVNGRDYLRDYNHLPAGNFRGLKIGEIDGTDSVIMEEGFEHLKGLESLWKINLDNNKYLTNESLGFLCSYTRERLRWLAICRNGNISDKGLHHLRVMKKLNYLKLEKLPEVKEPAAVLAELRHSLPDCQIIYPPYTSLST